MRQITLTCGPQRKKHTSETWVSEELDLACFADAQRLRALMDVVARFVGRRSPFVGTAETVANEIERWFRAGAVDGFNLHVARPGDFDRFLNEVVPILQERRLFRRDYDGNTLRSHLGLPIPENRYTLARQAEAIAAE